MLPSYNEIYFETIEQKSATFVFIWVLPLFSIKKLSFSFSPNQNQQIAPDKYFCERNSRKLLSNTRRKLCSKPIIKKITPI